MKSICRGTRTVPGSCKRKTALEALVVPHRVRPAEGESDTCYTLHLDGINYEANIWLNGKLVARRDQVIGMFRRFEFP